MAIFTDVLFEIIKNQLTVMCTTVVNIDLRNKNVLVKISLYCPDCAETEKRASITGDNLQLR